MGGYFAGLSSEQHVGATAMRYVGVALKKKGNANRSWPPLPPFRPPSPLLSA